MRLEFFSFVYVLVFASIEIGRVHCLLFGKIPKIQDLDCFKVGLTSSRYILCFPYKLEVVLLQKFRSYIIFHVVIILLHHLVCHRLIGACSLSSACYNMMFFVILLHLFIYVGRFRQANQI